MKRIIIVLILLICAFVAFLTANGGRYGGIALPWAKPLPKDNAIIVYSLDSGFSPSSVTINSGDTVEIRNLSTQRIVVESDIATTDRDKSNTELNLGAIEPNSHKDFTITNKGTFEYHNDIHPEQKGDITVQ